MNLKPHTYPKDIYTEGDADSNTLAHLGPLAALAGIWQGDKGMDTSPKADGPEDSAYIERVEMQPIDAQANGPQIYYGLRYHIHIVEPGEVETFHDQVGYWLWEPATGNLIQTLTIPRGMTAMATGNAAADAKTFTVTAKRGANVNGISSNPFLEESFRMESYTITVTVHDDGTWSYEQNTVMTVPNYDKPFEHTDFNTLHKVGEATPNPTALAEQQS